MGSPALGVDNLFSIFQYPGTIVDASTQVAGKEADRVASGRRSTIDHWTPTADNLLAWLRADNLTSHTADYLAIDRGHNLGGETIELRKSTDNFVSNDVLVFSAVIPTTVTENDTLTTTNGVLTPEGAWIREFTSTSSRYWRLNVLAMGAGLRPRIVNAWLGELYKPATIHRPVQDEDDVPRGPETESEFGWLGLGRTVIQRVGELPIKLTSFTEYNTGPAVHIRDNFNKRRPMWIVYDDTRAERAVLGIRPKGRSGFGFRGRWSYRQSVLRWVEWEPKID